MSRLRSVSEPSIITVRTNARLVDAANGSRRPDRGGTTFTGLIGAVCMLPLRAIIAACVALRIHPNTLTLIGVIVNVGAAWALGYQAFMLAFFVMIVANIFDFIDGKVAHRLQLQS